MNGVKNATALDGAADWLTYTPAAGGMAITTDETEIGGPGRAVVVATGNSTGVQVFSLFTSELQFAPGERIEAFSHFAAWAGSSPLPAQLRVVWYDGAGSSVGEETLPLQPAKAGRRGLPSTFAFGRTRVSPPNGVTRARLNVIATSTGGGQVIRIAMLKPFLGGVAAGAPSPCWTPGPHSNPDLDLDVWPGELMAWRDIDSPRTPNRNGFQTDAGIPATRRTGTRSRIRFSGELMLDLPKRDLLDQFIEARLLVPESRPFWFVHPDTRQLCRAWIDPEEGEPADSGRGRERRTRVGLLLEIA